MIKNIHIEHFKEIIKPFKSESDIWFLFNFTIYQSDRSNTSEDDLSGQCYDFINNQIDYNIHAKIFNPDLIFSSYIVVEA